VLLEANKVTKQFGAFRALDGADLHVEEGEIVGLIGPNGAGKSTFFNCLVGDMAPDMGRVVFAGRDVTRATPEEHARLGMGRTFQVPATFEDMTVVENVMVGAFLRHPERRAARAAAEKVVERVGLGELAETRARSLGTPGRKRLEIARVLATEPRLMLLDEALAGLTPAEIVRAIELVRQIHASGVTIVIVEHIMEVILSLTGRIIVFNQGRIIAAGAPREVVEDPAVVTAYLGHSLKRRTKPPTAGEVQT
jgi:branched-chain amino acid transport system ATP-binding protein